MYMVIIEWDGKKAPTKYYHRLRSMGLKVRTQDLADILEKGLEPIQRRLQDNGRGGVTLQEGCILTPSESQARAVSLLAQRYGARTVMIAPDVSLQEFEATADDMRTVAHIDSILGRRGKPPAPSIFHVSCLDEVAAHVVTASGVATCPHCGSPNILVREVADQVIYRMPDDPLDAIQYWAASRFDANGDYTIPQEAVGAGVAPTAMQSTAGAGTIAHTGISKLAQAGLNVQEIVLVLDAVHIAANYLSEERRTIDRLNATTKFLQKGGSPLGLRLDDQADVWRAACRLELDYMADIALAVSKI